MGQHIEQHFAKTNAVKMHTIGLVNNKAGFISSDRPFVSGIYFITKPSCNTIIAQKKKKMADSPRVSLTTGNTNVMMVVAITQWVRLPRVCPFARTELGNISEINTHMQAPCDMAKKAI